MGWPTRYAPERRRLSSELLTLGVNVSRSVSRSTIPRVWASGSTDPLGSELPEPRLRPTNRLATPVRLVCPIVAIVPRRSGVSEWSLMLSCTSASP